MPQPLSMQKVAPEMPLDACPVAPVCLHHPGRHARAAPHVPKRRARCARGGAINAPRRERTRAE
eukprot:13466071-Alexandrium_andersonii.AAC.1